MVKHREKGQEYWCLPGGTIDPGETPEEAALRELREECGVAGRLMRLTSAYTDRSTEYSTYTYHVDVGDQEPVRSSGTARSSRT
jgi:8-oxo-dGTP pyrophosphatase MutT (NUDIX family)